MSFKDKFETFLYKNVTLRLHKHTKLFNFLRALYALFYKNTPLNEEYQIKQWTKHNINFVHKHNLLPVYFDAKEAYFQDTDLKYYYNPYSKAGTLMHKGAVWETPILYMSNQVKKLKGKAIVFDIGANIGKYSMKLAKNFPKSKIYAFEPVPETFATLKKNTEANKLTNLRTFNYAISDKNGKILMTNDEGTGNHIVSNKTKRSSIVTTIKLDDFVKKQKLKKIDLIKIDVEGAELQVLKGGSKTIKKFKPILVLEIFKEWTERYGYQPEEIFKKLLNLGYSYKLIEKKFKKGNIRNLEKELKEAHNFVFEPKL